MTLRRGRGGARAPRGTSALPGPLLVFAALYGGYGALSPFLPAFLKARGLSPQEIAGLLAGAMLVRMAAGPLIGALADRSGGVRRPLGAALAAAGALTLAFLPLHGFSALLAVGLLQAAATAPLAPLADALALARGTRAYGRVRAAGSGAFVALSVLTGWLVAASGTGAAPALGGALFVLAAFAALLSAPIRPRAPPASGPPPLGVPVGSRPAVGAKRPERLLDGARALLASGPFRRLVLAAACVIAAHAMHDAFAVIVWTEAGIDARGAGLLWAEAVASEILAFLWLGPRLLARLGPGRVIALCALAGALRWGVQAGTAWWPALVLIQALHGLTFACLHLACLAGIAASVPERLRATALNLYGNLGLGLASALATLAAGHLYAAFGPPAFLAMSGLSLAALPLAWRLRRARACEA